MMKLIAFSSCIILLFSCAANKKLQSVNKMPACLETKIETMTADPHEGSPLSITRYIYNQQSVYYMESSCCDKTILYMTAFVIFSAILMADTQERVMEK